MLAAGCALRVGRGRRAERRGWAFGGWYLGQVSVAAIAELLERRVASARACGAMAPSKKGKKATAATDVSELCLRDFPAVADKRQRTLDMFMSICDRDPSANAEANGLTAAPSSICSEPLDVGTSELDEHVAETVNGDATMAEVVTSSGPWAAETRRNTQADAASTASAAPMTKKTHQQRCGEAGVAADDAAGQPPSDVSCECADPADSDNALAKLMELLRDGEDGGNMGKLESAVGAELTESNLAALEAYLRNTNKIVEHARPTAALSMAPHDAKKLKLYEDASRSGGPAFRTSLYNEFLAEHKVGTPQGEQYRQCGSRREAGEFRKAWADAKLAEFKQSKVYTRKHSEVNTTTADYLNFGQLVIEQGGWSDRAAIQGSVRLVKRCLALGPPFVREHGQTGRMLFARLRYTWEEKFEEAWAELKEEFSTGAQADKDNGGMGGDATTMTQSVGAGVEGKRASEGSDANKTKQARTNKDTDAPTKGEKAAMSKLLADATKLKRDFLSQTAMCVELLSQIRESKDWKWAKNEDNMGVLEAVAAKVREPLTDFHRRFLTEETAVIKRQFSSEMLSKELTEFLKLRPSLQALTLEMNRLVKRHKA